MLVKIHLLVSQGPDFAGGNFASILLKFYCEIPSSQPRPRYLGWVITGSAFLIFFRIHTKTILLPRRSKKISELENAVQGDHQRRYLGGPPKIPNLITAGGRATSCAGARHVTVPGTAVLTASKLEVHYSSRGEGAFPASGIG